MMPLETWNIETRVLETKFNKWKIKIMLSL